MGHSKIPTLLKVTKKSIPFEAQRLESKTLACFLLDIQYIFID